MISSRRSVLRDSSAFTLIEVILAIALSAVLLFLLTTAIELYMVRVDTSRGRVESAQLARAILDQMAADLTATRLYAPPAPLASGQTGQGSQPGSNSRSGAGAGAGGGTSGGGGGTGSGMGTGISAGSGGVAGGTGSGPSAESTSSELTPPTEVQGLYGTANELRIDRSAPANWQRASRVVEPVEPANRADMPRSVRYYLAEGSAQAATEMAQRGVDVEREASASVSGLYRETIPTAALGDDSDPLATPGAREGAVVELLAPEVVKLEIHYFDGEQLVDEWDALEESSLPAGVEILLTLHEPEYGTLEVEEPRQTLGNGRSYRESELVEYRRFVRLPTVSTPQPAEALWPQPNGGGPAEGNQPGTGGGGSGTSGGTTGGTAGSGGGTSGT